VCKYFSAVYLRLIHVAAMYHVFNDLLATFYCQLGRHFHGQIEGFDTLTVFGIQQQYIAVCFFI